MGANGTPAFSFPSLVTERWGDRPQRVGPDALEPLRMEDSEQKRVVDPEWLIKR